MAAICRGRSVFIIAHRLSAVRLANRIFVLDKGRLVEGGTPKALMEKKGFFYNMVMRQNQMSAPRPAPMPTVRKEPEQ